MTILTTNPTLHSSPLPPALSSCPLLRSFGCHLRGQHVLPATTETFRSNSFYSHKEPDPLNQHHQGSSAPAPLQDQDAAEDSHHVSLLDQELLKHHSPSLVNPFNANNLRTLPAAPQRNPQQHTQWQHSFQPLVSTPPRKRSGDTPIICGNKPWLSPNLLPTQLNCSNRHWSTTQAVG